MKAWRRVWGPTRLAMPARPARRATLRAAAWRSSRLPSRPTRIGPSQRSPTTRSNARAVRGARGKGYDLASLAGNGERSVSALERQAFDVGADGLRHPEAV